jgi:hypothetical protein
MVQSVTHKQLEVILNHYYNSYNKKKEGKEALFIWGTFGIGKSESTYKVARNLAKQKNKQFIVWGRITREEKQEVLKNPTKYFVLIDIRLSEYTADDIKGLPVFADNNRSIDFKSPMWALLLEKKMGDLKEDGGIEVLNNSESDGVLFFDEINLAVPLVVSSCYKIIYDRIINDSKISGNWLVIGCGNMSSDRAYTHDMSPPLRDRGGEVELVLDTNAWTTDWATSNGIRSQIIGYVNWKRGDVLRRVDFDDNQKFTTPRGWERVNNLMTGVEWGKNKEGLPFYEWLDLITGTAIGEAVATEFVAYCKIQELFNMEDLIKTPQKIKELRSKKVEGLRDGDDSIIYFIATAVGEQYKDKAIPFSKVIEVSRVLDEMNMVEEVAYMWKLSSAYTKKFKEDFVKNVDIKMAEKYGRFIID